MKQFVVSDDACTLCFDRVANTMLRDCGHRGFCDVCAIQLERCPICRKEIGERVRCSSSSSSTSPSSSLTTTSTAALANPTVSGSPGPKADVLSTPPGPVLIPTPVV
ncbi:RING finger and SPRY domain-containing protein 1 [Elysia marginata]|uniref:RING finger and SPRY domain-containing protein 1 n=1 Tax=Elysia marginata TaxID=1093978 RepID=A0AAV4GCJ1_9GAST|nr:RING finger and SPRY domain-containing protein 1 [Elysia marginata]